MSPTSCPRCGYSGVGQRGRGFVNKMMKTALSTKTGQKLAKRAIHGVGKQLTDHALAQAFKYSSAIPGLTGLSGIRALQRGSGVGSVMSSLRKNAIRKRRQARHALQNALKYSHRGYSLKNTYQKGRGIGSIIADLGTRALKSNFSRELAKNVGAAAMARYFGPPKEKKEKTLQPDALPDHRHQEELLRKVAFYR